MGSLALPASGLVYADSMTLIYTVERNPNWPLLEPLWLASQARSVEVVSSELALLEVLVGPLKSGNTTLVSTFEKALLATDLRLLPITQSILRDAAKLRAATKKLRNPDALHAATSRDAGCVSFITNDVAFRAVTGLPLVILDDLLKP